MGRAEFATSSKAFRTRTTGGERVIDFPGPHARGMQPCENVQFVTDAEIAQMVSVALDDAITALGEPNPEEFIQLRAYEARAAIREMRSALPRGKSRDPKVVEEYRRALVFQNLTLDLALNLIASIRRYARVYEREIAPERHLI